VEVSYLGELEAYVSVDYVAKFEVVSNDLNKDVLYNWEITLDPENAEFTAEFSAWKDAEGEWTLINTYTVDNIYLTFGGSITVQVTAKNWADGESPTVVELSVWNLKGRVIIND